MTGAASRTGAVQGDLWSAHAAAWADVQEAKMRPLYEAGLDALGVGAGMRHLDAGCGAGLALSIAAGRGAQVAALDAAPGLLAIARSRVPGARIEEGDIEELPFEDASFDTVSGFNSFQFAGDPDTALGEARRVLRPGGRVLAATWAPAEMCELAPHLAAIAALLPPAPPGSPGPFALSGDGALAGVLARAGFRPIETRDVVCRFDYASDEEAVRGMASGGPCVRARAPRRDGRRPQYHPRLDDAVPTGRRQLPDRKRVPLHRRGARLTGPVPQPPAASPTEGEAFRFWLKLGFISFGGPAGQIAIMHDELVERRRWISEPRFLHALNFCMALPGPEAQQLAAYIGYSLHGVRGGITSGGLFVLPSFVVLCVMSGIYVEYGTVTVVEGVVRGLGAAVVALVAAAVLRVGGRVVHTPAAVALAAAAFVLILVGVPFPAILAAAALAGYAARRFTPGLLGAPAAAREDEAGREARAGASLRRRLGTAAVVWLVPVAGLVAAGGVIGDLAGFFTVAALVTFGGAYAVLPFVANQAVTHYHWLTSRDMVAGLALGESTPGPLIMVNTFVGFLAGYHVEGGLAWGVLGATTATMATFVPCFVFIIGGAPVIDRVRATGGFAGGLAGVTVAVVGVIAALAVFVGRHALLVGGHVDRVLVVLAGVAFVAVWRYRIGVVRVVVAAACAGVLDTLLR